jgi:2-dehydropantoate 2-reductase
MPNASPDAAKACVERMVEFNRPSAKTHSGVWRDLAIRKRRTEVDVQIAPIAEIGARHGIACRATRKLVAMIHEVEEGRRAMIDDNLLELARVN